MFEEVHSKILAFDLQNPRSSSTPAASQTAIITTQAPQRDSNSSANRGGSWQGNCSSRGSPGHDTQKYRSWRHNQQHYRSNQPVHWNGPSKNWKSVIGLPALLVETGQLQACWGGKGSSDPFPGDPRIP
ncbi:hypothetical protein D8674_000434 [Pyrus ussuriensis x Pyrus communis]|uniref:Uncharacterized protein n=1 Tax=Pyrus ussuriensis x Pyrus communis TaxID=2448454 RepID=A0A5N5FGL8_9ROSA|nr:hypothetical protein D8674_000434 [Pyrus ussuriensis x Pyrus communis]